MKINENQLTNEKMKKHFLFVTHAVTYNVKT